MQKKTPKSKFYHESFGQGDLPGVSPMMGEQGREEGMVVEFQ
jgi:hypothetical protein